MKKFIRLFRPMSKNPRLTLINVLGMALGLVTAGIILGIVYQEFNYDPDSVNSSRIYRVIQKNKEKAEPYTYAPLAQALKSNFPEIQETARISFFTGYLACSAGDNKYNENKVIFSDPDFFSLFSFPLIKGNAKECLIPANAVVISEKAAKKYFGNEDPIGKTMLIGGKEKLTVTGIYKDLKANSNFEGNIVLPLKQISKLTQSWIAPNWKYKSDINIFLLLSNKANASTLVEKARNLISKYNANDKSQLLFQRLKDIHIEDQYAWDSAPQVNVKYLYILVAVALIILIISSANFLFLYIGSSDRRSVSTGIKKVCGASGSVLFREHFGEVIALMLLSSALAGSLYLVYNTLLVRYFPNLPQVGFFDHKLLLFLGLVVLAVTFISGIYPSIILSSRQPVSIFNTHVKSAGGKFRLINILVVGQFGLCIALIAFTSLMYKQINFLETKGTGYAKNELITIPLNMHAGQGIYNEKFDAFAQELKKFPEIKNVTLAASSPSSVPDGKNAPNWEGKPKNTEVKMSCNFVSYDYFETVGLKMVRGRSFNRNFPGDETNLDNKHSAFILNQSAVKQMGLNDPIGKEFEVWGFKGPIIGVVEDYNFKSLHSAITPLFFQMNPFYLNDIIVRIDPSSQSVFSDIKKVWDKFVPDYPLEFNYVSDQIKALYQPEQDLAKTLNIFSLMAILIACIGLFTLTVLSTGQKIKEIGIRKINGARTNEILVMLNMNFVKRVAIAFLLACPIAWYAMHRWLENFAYKTTLSWWVFVLAGGIALAVALLTVSFQSWKAATKNPVEALRYE